VTISDDMPVMDSMSRSPQPTSRRLTTLDALMPWKV
jgi:hypothetical protein